MYVSLKDVAARAGVSFQTVSKVLKGSNVNLTAETRERVLRAASELGYVPNAIARGLVTQSSCTIGIIADDLSDWVLAQFVVGAERQARQDGHGVLISIALGAARDTESCIQDLIERRVEGIVVAAPQLENDEAVGRLLRARVPAVSLQHVPGGGLPTVGSDHRATGRLATAHLTDLDHRRIATITGPAQRHVVASRLHGYREALAEAGVRQDGDLVEESDWSTEGGYRATLRLLEARPRPTAIFAQNDRMAIGVLSALHARGVRVPDDVAVVGCDDLPIAAYTVPTLTTVHVPFYETGARAVSLLLEGIGGLDRSAEEQRRELLPVWLVPRGSSTHGGTRPVV